MNFDFSPLSRRVLALRIDDIGASTKVHERYCSRRWLNVGILRDRRLFGAWGPYREMTGQEWRDVITLLRERSAKLTVAVTAAWVEEDGSLTPFPEKFPEEAEALREGARAGVLELAAHGLTHSVLKDKLFLPRLFGSNRSHHREFWDWLPDEVHTTHVRRSVETLRTTFGSGIVTFVPPGNVYSAATLRACAEMGVQVVNCSNPRIPDPTGKLRVLGNDGVLAFHDRELVLHGIGWLRKRLDEVPAGTEFRFVKDL